MGQIWLRDVREMLCLVRKLYQPAPMVIHRHSCRMIGFMECANFKVANDCGYGIMK
jgi:hypothetical protein